jgi:hypothetical protein
MADFTRIEYSMITLSPLVLIQFELAINTSLQSKDFTPWLGATS